MIWNKMHLIISRFAWVSLPKIGLSAVCASGNIVTQTSTSKNFCWAYYTIQFNFSFMQVSCRKASKFEPNMVIVLQFA